MRQRRQAERSQQRGGRPADQPTRVEIEQRRQHLLLLAAVVVVVLVPVILLAGFYFSNVRPPGRVTAVVGPVEIKLGEVADLGSFLVLEGLVSSGNIAAVPQQASQLLVRNEVIRQTAPELEVTVSPSEINLTLAQQFEPVSDDPDAPLAVVLSAEGEEQYKQYRELVEVSNEGYRSYLEGDLLWQALLVHHNSLTPQLVEQVFLHWIVVAGSATADEIRQRLDEGEDFSALAEELNQEVIFSDEMGEVGWVPRGLFPELDEEIFALELGEYLGPIETSLGVMIAQITQGPEETEMAADIRTIVVDQARSDWYQTQVAEQLTEFNLDQSSYDWVIDELNIPTHAG